MGGGRGLEFKNPYRPWSAEAPVGVPETRPPALAIYFKNHLHCVLSNSTQKQNRKPFLPSHQAVAWEALPANSKDWRYKLPSISQEEESDKMLKLQGKLCVTRSSHFIRQASVPTARLTRWSHFISHACTDCLADTMKPLHQTHTCTNYPVDVVMQPGSDTHACRLPGSQAMARRNWRDDFHIHPPLFTEKQMMAVTWQWNSEQ